MEASLEAHQSYQSRYLVTADIGAGKRLLPTCMLCLAIAACIFTPQDGLGIKKALIALNLLLNLPLFLTCGFQKEIIIYAVGYPTAMAILSFIVFPSSQAIAGYWFFCLLLMVAVIRYYKIDYQKMLVTTLCILAAIMILSFSLDILGIYKINDNKFLMWMHQNGEGMIGYNPNLAFPYTLFFKASPLLLCLLAYFLGRDSLPGSLFVLFALYLSGTRANFFMGIAIIGIYTVFLRKNDCTKVVFILLCIIGAIAMGEKILGRIIEIFSIKASADAIRTGHLESILDLFQAEPWRLIMGYGYGASFFSKGIDAYTTVAELSYWEILRQGGLISFLPLLYFWLKPIRRLWQNAATRWLVIGYAGYMIAAYTNPFLLSTTSCVLYILVYAKYYEVMELSRKTKAKGLYP